MAGEELYDDGLLVLRRRNVLNVIGAGRTASGHERNEGRILACGVDPRLHESNRVVAMI
jgi:hypothetical protein